VNGVEAIGNRESPRKRKKKRKKKKKKKKEERFYFLFTRRGQPLRFTAGPKVVAVAMADGAIAVAKREVTCTKAARPPKQAGCVCEFELAGPWHA